VSGLYLRAFTASPEEAKFYLYSLYIFPLLCPLMRGILCLQCIVCGEEVSVVYEDLFTMSHPISYLVPDLFTRPG